MPSGRPSFRGSHPSHRPYLARKETVQCVDPQAFWLAIQLIISVMISRALWGAPICRKEGLGWITQQSERKEVYLFLNPPTSRSEGACASKPRPTSQVQGRTS